MMNKKGVSGQVLIFLAALIIIIVVTGTQIEIFAGTTDDINEGWVFNTCNDDRIDGGEGSYNLQIFSNKCPCDVDSDDDDDYDPKFYTLNSVGIEQAKLAFGIEGVTQVSQPDAEAIGYFINENVRTNYLYSEPIAFDWFLNSKLDESKAQYSGKRNDKSYYNLEANNKKGFIEKHLCGGVTGTGCTDKVFLRYWFNDGTLAEDELPVAECKTDELTCRKKYIDICGEEDES